MNNKENDIYESLLKSMGLSSNKINTVLNTINEDVLCDAECKRNKYLDKLKKDMEVARQNEENATSNFNETEKKYYMFKDGEYGYKRLMFDRYKKEGNNLKLDILKKQKEIMNNIKMNIDKIDNYEETNNLLQELYKKLERENKELSNKIDENRAITYTNERKIEYESNDIKKINLSFIIILIISLILVVVYIGLYIFKGRFIKDKYYKNIKKWIPLIIIVVIPILIQLLYKFIYKMYYNIKKSIERNDNYTIV